MPLVWHVVAWVREICPTPFDSYHLQQVRELTQHLSSSCTKEEGPGPHLGNTVGPCKKGMGELSLEA